MAPIAAAYKHGLPRGKSTGWRAVDEFYTVKQGEFTVVTGIPGHGKSEWLDALMVNLARNHNYRFNIFSPENYPLELHCVKLMEKFMGMPFDPGPTERMSKEGSLEALTWLQDHFAFITPPEDKLNLEGLLEAAMSAHRMGNPMGVVLDPWNEIDHRRPDNFSETEYISHCLTTIRRFTRDVQFPCHMWVVAHPTKLSRDKEGKYPVPTPYDISGSAHWRNKADNCVTIWRDMTEQTQMVEVHVQKVRFKKVGKVGMAQLRYDRVTGRYFDVLHAVDDYKRASGHDYGEHI
jgi:twinkle protein